jgi:hypothetical protein
MENNKVTYTVQVISRPFGPSEIIPWDKGSNWDGLSASKAIRVYNEKWRRYNHGSGWSGHVRIVGSDDWIYGIDGPMPGERASLARLYHLDDI